jgi:hypothetical protein
MSAEKQFNNPKGKTKDWKKHRLAPAFGQGKHSGAKAKKATRKKRKNKSRR